jgi:hypothetical protein
MSDASQWRQEFDPPGAGSVVNHYPECSGVLVVDAVAVQSHDPTARIFRRSRSMTWWCSCHTVPWEEQPVRLRPLSPGHSHVGPDSRDSSVPSVPTGFVLLNHSTIPDSARKMIAEGRTFSRSRRRALRRDSSLILSPRLPCLPPPALPAEIERFPHLRAAGAPSRPTHRGTRGGRRRDRASRPPRSRESARAKAEDAVVFWSSPRTHDRHRGPSAGPVRWGLRSGFVVAGQLPVVGTVRPGQLLGAAGQPGLHPLRSTSGSPYRSARFLASMGVTFQVKTDRPAGRSTP